MKKVLWISRHALTPEQTAGLEHFCGSEVNVCCWKENVEDLQCLMPYVLEADVIAAVLPLHLLAQLVQVAQQRPVLISMAKRILVPVEGSEPMVCFTHGGWSRIAKLELELAPTE